MLKFPGKGGQQSAAARKAKGPFTPSKLADDAATVASENVEFNADILKKQSIRDRAARDVEFDPEILFDRSVRDAVLDDNTQSDINNNPKDLASFRLAQKIKQKYPSMDNGEAMMRARKIYDDQKQTSNKSFDSPSNEYAPVYEKLPDIISIIAGLFDVFAAASTAKGALIIKKAPMISEKIFQAFEQAFKTGNNDVLTDAMNGGNAKENFITGQAAKKVSNLLKPLGVVAEIVKGIKEGDGPNEYSDQNISGTSKGLAGGIVASADLAIGAALTTGASIVVVGVFGGVAVLGVAVGGVVTAGVGLVYLGVSNTDSALEIKAQAKAYISEVLEPMVQYVKDNYNA